MASVRVSWSAEQTCPHDLPLTWEASRPGRTRTPLLDQHSTGPGYASILRTSEMLDPSRDALRNRPRRPRGQRTLPD